MNKLKLWLLFGVLWLLPCLVSAESLGTGQGFVLLGTIISIIVCCLFFFVVAIISSNTPLKIFFTGLGAVCLLFNIGFGIIIIQSYFPTTGSINNIFNNFFFLMATLFGGAMILTGIGFFAWAILSFKKKRGRHEDENLMD